MNLVLSRHAQVGDEDFAVGGLHAVLGVAKAAYGEGKNGILLSK